MAPQGEDLCTVCLMNGHGSTMRWRPIGCYGPADRVSERTEDHGVTVGLRSLWNNQDNAGLPVARGCPCAGPSSPSKGGAVPRQKSDEYRQRAAACQAAADVATIRSVKEQLEGLARQWNVLAWQRDMLDGRPARRPPQYD